MNKQVIKINGTAYDAVTGKHIQPEAPSEAEKVTVTTKKAKTNVATPKPLNHTAHRQTQSTKTLMRRAVKKPAPGLKKKVQTQLSHSSEHTVTVKRSARSVNPKRAATAQAVPQNEQVSRFGHSLAVPITFAHVPVQPAPAKTAVAVTPATPPPTTANKPVDMFEQAIANANYYVDLAARKGHIKKKVRRHIMSMAAGSFALLLIAGFAAYQNTPGLQLKVAGIRAGVATGSQNFQAAGFAFNGVRAHNSKLLIGLKAADGDYQLTEQSTNWSGEDMIKHISSVNASGQPNYSTVAVGESNAYQFAKDQATWVKNGTWYHIKGNKPLTSDQIKALVENT